MNLRRKSFRLECVSLGRYVCTLRTVNLFKKNIALPLDLRFSFHLCHLFVRGHLARGTAGSVSVSVKREFYEEREGQVTSQECDTGNRSDEV